MGEFSIIYFISKKKFSNWKHFKENFEKNVFLSLSLKKYIVFCSEYQLNFFWMKLEK